MAGRADGSVIIDTRMNTSGFQTGVANIKRGFSGLSSALGKIAKVMVGVFAVKQLVNFGREAIELGSDLSEVQNVVDVTFGNLNQEINNFASNAIEQFGLSETAAKQYTSTMGAMLKSMGFTTRQAADMSMTMTGLAADMASFYNLNAEDAFYKIRAGISGETEPLKQLGINLNVANLEQYALTQGINKSYNAMTQQEQALLRYNYLLSVTSDAQGDFTRTSESWANQTRILSENFKALKATIGQGLINIFTTVIKVINILLGKLATVANAFKAFTELITGKKSSGATSGSGAGATGDSMTDMGDGYNSAADGVKNYADATEDAADATKKANKANKTYLSGLDEIRRYSEDITEIVPEQKGDSGGTLDELPGVNAGGAVDYGSLAEGETVIDELSDKLLAVKDILAGLFKPFKDAWSVEGQGVIDAASTALSNIGELAQSVGKSFYDVWTNGTGTTTLSTIFEIAKNILTTVGNLAGKFTEAWNTAGTGTSIIQGIFDLLNIVLGTIRDMSGATAEWAKTLDFTPLLTSINDLLIALQPLAQNIGDGLAWFYQNVLLPLAGFTIEEIIPRFFETLGSVLAIVNAVLEALQPLFDWFWNTVLKPIAEWTGGIFLQIWDGINGALQTFSDWCKENPGVIQNVAIVIGSFFAAFKLSSLITSAVGAIKGLIGIISGAGGLSGAIGGIVSALGGPLTIAIGAAIAAGVLLYKNWDSIKAAAGKLKDWVVGKWGEIKTKTKEIWNNVKTTVKGAWENMKSWASEKFTAIKDSVSKTWENAKTTTSSIWSGIKSSLSGTWSALKSNASSVFSGIKSSISTAWNNVKSSSTSIWNGIKQSVINAISAIGKSASDVGGKIKSAFTNAFSGIAGAIKAPINSIIGLINGLISGVVAGINLVLSAFNKLKIDIPRWVPGIGGKRLGFNFGQLTAPQIPYLATGAVIPPNAPFMAVLGDQRRGTNVEAPLSTIEQAVTNAIKKNGSGSQNMTIRIPIILEGRQIFEAVIDEAKMKQMISGRNPFEMA